MSRPSLDFLRDARRHAWRAWAFADLDRDAFVNSEAPVEAIYHVLILGEALKNIPSPIRSLAPNIPWRLVIGMRNVLIHEYCRVDLATVHWVLTKKLSPLMEAIDDLIELLEQSRP